MILRFLLRRLALLVPILLGVVTLVFLAVHFIPGDPAQVMLGERATPEALSKLRHEMGLDQPLIVQYGRFLSHAVVLDFGRSITTNDTVLSEIWAKFPATVELSVTALLLATVIGVPLGIVSALRRGSWVDAMSMGLALGGVSMPIFWLGLMIMMLFSATLGWFPFGGRLDIATTLQPLTGFYLLDALLRLDYESFSDAMAHLFLPSLTLATVPMAIIARMTRAAMLEVLGQDYVRTAKAKGVAPFTVVVRHALRNAGIPIVTVTGLQLGYLLSGAVLTERVFAWPGLGNLSVEAVFLRDFPVLQGCVTLFALSFVLVNLLVDLSYFLLDPRVRDGGHA
jgi:ABC-type dipeptide/oligopeptide/nickel transport system permease component